MITMRLMGKISKKIQERVTILKRAESVEKEEKGSSEYLAAFIIVLAVLMSILLSFLGYLENKNALKESVRETVLAAAEIDKTVSFDKTEPVDDPFNNYQQLSDPLLVLVNDKVPLPENWQVTPRMVDDELVDLRMYSALTEMFESAAKDEVWFWVASGYRSVQEQEIILDRAVKENKDAGMNGAAALEEALRTIARPGYSEHHTGLTVDLNDVSDDFESTEAYRWLSEHGADYGFVQRYKADKAGITGIDNESWHYRYVGKKHAKEMEKLDFCLEEYVLYLKKQGRS